MEYSIIVPVYNEAENLESLNKDIFDFFIGLNTDFEVIYVNDGSDDVSLKILQGLRERFLRIKIVSFLRRQGQSMALYAGFKEARGSLIVTLDADQQNSPAQLVHFLMHLSDHDMVTGCRVNRKDGFLKRVSSRCARHIRQFVLGDDFDDIGCSLRLFKREIVDQVPLFINFHRFFPYLVKKAGFKVAVVNIAHYQRRFGRSKYGVWNRLCAGALDLFGVWWLSRRMITKKDLLDGFNGE